MAREPRSPDAVRTVRAQLIEKGVAPTDVHYEVFGPDLWPATAS